MKWEKAGVTPLATRDARLATLRWPGAARFYWMNVAEPKAEAEVALQAGDYPLLVWGECGEGRVATVLGTCHGEATRETVAAWDEFVAIYVPPVYRLAVRQGLQAADAEDVEVADFGLT